MTWELGHLLPPVDLRQGVVDAKQHAMRGAQKRRSEA